MIIERKMASVQKIVDIFPIVKADTLEVVTILGWKCVVKKGKFKKNDLCVYFEIDSILPDREEFNFIKEKTPDMILRTMRMRGQLSQGLCWNLNILPVDIRSKAYEGMDVTDILGVGKYEEQIRGNMIGKSKCLFPRIVSRPHETRVQSFPELINEFMGKMVAETTKIDGEAAAFINDADKLHVCCHSHSLFEDSKSIYWEMARKYNILSVLRVVGHFSILGEIAGPGIYGNKMGLFSHELFVFKIFNNDTQQYLSPTAIINFCDLYKLQHVPMELNVPFNFTLEELIERAKGTYQPSGHQREGIVIVPMKPCYSEILCGNLSMKVINNDYLLADKNKKRR